MVDIPEFKRDDSLDYQKILRALMEIPFSLGRNLLCDHLMGKYNNSSITKNKLDELTTFGGLAHWSRDEILDMVERMIRLKMIEQVALDGNSFAKVLKITLRGQNELARPTLDKPPEPILDVVKTEISDWDKKVFNEYADFLVGLNDEQKKAVVTPSKSVLTIAGAGSGKTSVLVRRIEFLVKKRGVDPSEILAITFTRKAKDEMEERLWALGVDGVQVSTFNAFGEGILRQYGREIYGRQMRVLTYADKMLALNLALYHHNLEIEDVIDEYFSASQKKLKTKQQLHNIFLNDCFTLIDYFKTTRGDIYDFSKDADADYRDMAQLVYKIVLYLSEHKRTQGLRSFSDQLVDVVSAFKKRPAIIPYFEHVLVDEYQDVNAIQVEILNLLNKDNIFAVGDPRQAIYGWRGSDMNFILNFEADFGETEVIHLTRNYRSSESVVDLINHAISHMNLPPLRATREIEGDLKLFSFETEEAERQFVIQVIEPLLNAGEDVFVLARMNRQILEVADVLKRRGVAFTLKTDDFNGNGQANQAEMPTRLTLATVHAIKGLEADNVFLIGANKDSFPCRASDHPIVELIKDEKYDKFEEEKRLFYVALSRSKKNLYVTYSGTVTDFITREMEELF